MTTTLRLMFYENLIGAFHFQMFPLWCHRHPSFFATDQQASNSPFAGHSWQHSWHCLAQWLHHLSRCDEHSNSSCLCLQESAASVSPPRQSPHSIFGEGHSLTIRPDLLLCLENQVFCFIFCFIFCSGFQISALSIPKHSTLHNKLKISVGFISSESPETLQSQ